MVCNPVSQSMNTLLNINRDIQPICTNMSMQLNIKTNCCTEWVALNIFSVESLSMADYHYHHLHHCNSQHCFDYDSENCIGISWVHVDDQNLCLHAPLIRNGMNIEHHFITSMISIFKLMAGLQKFLYMVLAPHRCVIAGSLMLCWRCYCKTSWGLPCLVILIPSFLNATLKVVGICYTTIR